MLEEPPVPTRRSPAAARARRRIAATGAVLFTAALLTVGASSAHAAVLTAEGTDPAGDDVNTPNIPARDLRSLSVSFDGAGAATATVGLGAAASGPADDALIQVVFSKASGSDCGAPALAIRTATTGENPNWVLSTDPPGTAAEPATVSANGATLTLTASSARLASLRPDCAWVLTGSRAETKVFDTLSPIALKAPEAPAPPKPAPTPDPGPAPATPVPGAGNRPALAVSIDRGPAGVVRRGRTLTFKTTVRNVGSAEARGVKVRLAGARGITADTKAFTAKTLAPGAALQKSVRVKLGSRTKATSTSNWRATADGDLTASAPLRLRVGKRLTPLDTGLAPVGRTYWRTDTIQAKSEYSGYMFVSDRFVWRGLGKPEDCKARTATTPDGPGCVPYAWNAKSGKLTIDGKPATIEQGNLKVPGADRRQPKTFFATEPVAAGARLAADLQAVTVLGNCVAISLNPSCSIVRRYLKLLPDGQYSLTRSSTTTSGGVGSLPFVAINGASPEDKGLYEVLPGSVLRLTPLAGEVQTFPLAVQIENGKADPATTGLLLAASDYNP